MFPLTYYCGMDTLNGMKNLEDGSRKEGITRNAFKKLQGLHLPGFLQTVCAHTNLKNATIHGT